MSNERTVVYISVRLNESLVMAFAEAKKNDGIFTKVSDVVADLEAAQERLADYAVWRLEFDDPNSVLLAGREVARFK